jgi:transposase
LEVVGQRVEPDRAVLACRVEPGEFDRWCCRCGGEGVPRDTVTRRLAHEPFGWRPTTLLVTIRRFRCGNCSRVWRQDTRAAAEPRARLSRTALRWALQAIVVQHLTIARVAEALAVSWDTANSAVLDEGRRVLINDPHRLDGVKVIGVDEHAWRHTRRGDKYVTVIIDLTPVRDGTGPARLLDMVEGRSKQVFKTWLDAQTAEFRDGIEVVAMDGFTGFKTAAAEVVPDAVAVMDPFPRRGAGRRRAGPLPTTRPATDPRASRPHRRPALRHPPRAAHRSRPAHRPATTTDPDSVRRPAARRG